MSTPKPANPEEDFVRRSETESVCMSCFMTIRASRQESLEKAEQNHAAECPGKT
jgi:hypothetical protein